MYVFFAKLIDLDSEARQYGRGKHKAAKLFGYPGPAIPWNGQGTDPRETAFNVGVELAAYWEKGFKKDICTFINHTYGGKSFFLPYTPCTAKYTGDNTDIQNHVRSSKVDEGGNLIK
jgi:hypothetical protein